MKIKTLDNIDPDELLSVFNGSFADYFVPLQLTAEQLQGKIKADKVNFSYSVGAFFNNQLVGFILHGFDIIDNRRVVYNAGTGVIPAYRNQALTKRMYDFILPHLKAENIDTLVLEVITQNIQAIKSYTNAGYQTSRKLLCYKGEINAATNNAVSVNSFSSYDWPVLRSTWNFTPSWQNSARVLEELKESNRSFGAFINNELAGYIVYNPASKRVQQFGINSKYRRQKIASTLFSYIKEPGSHLTIINVDESDTATNNFLIHLGLQKFVEQLEMKLELK